MMNQFLFPLLYIFGVNGFYITVFNKKFEECLPMTILSVPILMIITGFINKLSYGFYISLLMIGYFVFSLFYKTYKDKSYLIQFKNNFFTLGNLLFIIAYSYIMLLHKETTFIYWDEFMHWGFMAKESFRLNAFYSLDTSFLRVHKDYPPFATILEVLWCKLSGNYYSEPFTFRALSILIISFIIPQFKNFSLKKGKDYLKAGYILLLYLLIQVIAFNDFFPSLTDSIYTDYVLAALCAMGIFTAYNIKKINIFNTLNLTLILVATILCKQMGLPFYLLILFIFLIKHYKKLNKTNFIFIIIMIVLPLIFYSSWNHFVKSIAIDGQFSLSQINIKEFFNIAFNNRGKAHQLEAFKNYLMALINRPVLKLPVLLNYPLSVILITIILLITEKFNKKGYECSLTYFLGGLGYGLAMLLLYVFSFNDYEGPLLASYERYLGTYIYLGFVLIVFIVSIAVNSNEKIKLYHYPVIFTVIILFVQSNYIKLIPKANTNSYLDNPVYASIINAIENNHIIYKKILIIAQYQNDIKEVVQYSHPFNDFQIATIGKPKYEGDINAWDLSLKEYQKFLTQFDYLFISNTDEPFYQNFWQPTTDLELLNNQLYEIKYIDDKIILTYVN